MQALVDKYQPQTLDAFRGLGRPKRILQNFAANPAKSAWLLVGPSGLGKTSIGLALQKAIGGVLYHIPSRQCDLATVEEIAHHCQYKPWNGGRFNTILIDEVDQATKSAQVAFLSLLDATAMPEDSVWIFTANSLDKLEDRLVSRCRVVEFTSDDLDFREMLEYIWSQEAMERPAPDYDRIIKRANGNVRSALMNLEIELLDVPIAPKVKTEKRWLDAAGQVLGWDAVKARLDSGDFSGVRCVEVAA
jgi:DNA polymerase III delta prime subunit